MKLERYGCTIEFQGRQLLISDPYYDDEMGGVTVDWYFETKEQAIEFFRNCIKELEGNE